MACNSHKVLPAEYVKYVENPDNGLNLKQKVNGVIYTIQYEPTDYCVMLEERSFSVPEETFETERKRFKGLEHYIFRINKIGMDSLVAKLGDTAKYKKGVTEYLDFRIQKDIRLVKGSDTVTCSICQRDANTGISEYYTFSLGFYSKQDEVPVQEANADRTFLYNNKMLQTGNIMLRMRGKDIDHIPGLKML